MTRYAMLVDNSKQQKKVEKRKVKTKIGAPEGPMVGLTRSQKKTSKRVAAKR
jgi:hypothetical protein